MTENDDLAFINHPEKWPKWPVLPLIHRAEWTKQGFIVDGGPLLEHSQPVVYLGNIFEVFSHQQVNIRDLPTETYDTYTNLLKDWRID